MTQPHHHIWTLDNIERDSNGFPVQWRNTCRCGISYVENYSSDRQALLTEIQQLRDANEYCYQLGWKNGMKAALEQEPTNE